MIAQEYGKETEEGLFNLSVETMFINLKIHCIFESKEKN
jgi:hypothetical protein